MQPTRGARQRILVQQVAAVEADPPAVGLDADTGAGEQRRTGVRGVVDLDVLFAGVRQIGVYIEPVVSTEHRLRIVAGQRSRVLSGQREGVPHDRGVAPTVEVAGRVGRVGGVVDAAAARDLPLEVVDAVGELGVRQGVSEADGEVIRHGVAALDLEARDLAVTLVGGDRGHSAIRVRDRRGELDIVDLHLEDPDVQHEATVEPLRLHAQLVVDRLLLEERFVGKATVDDRDRTVETTRLVALGIDRVEGDVLVELEVDRRTRRGGLPLVIAAERGVIGRGRGRTGLVVHHRRPVDLSLALLGPANLEARGEPIREVETDRAEVARVVDVGELFGTVLAAQAREIDAIFLVLPLVVVDTDHPAQPVFLRRFDAQLARPVLEGVDVRRTANSHRLNAVDVGADDVDLRVVAVRTGLEGFIAPTAVQDEVVARAHDVPAETGRGELGIAVDARERQALAWVVDQSTRRYPRPAQGRRDADHPRTPAGHRRIVEVDELRLHFTAEPLVGVVGRGAVVGAERSRAGRAVVVAT